MNCPYSQNPLPAPIKFVFVNYGQWCGFIATAGSFRERWVKAQMALDNALFARVINGELPTRN